MKQIDQINKTHTLLAKIFPKSQKSQCSTNPFTPLPLIVRTSASANKRTRPIYSHTTIVLPFDTCTLTSILF